MTGWCGGASLWGPSPSRTASFSWSEDRPASAASETKMLGRRRKVQEVFFFSCC